MNKYFLLSWKDTNLQTSAFAPQGTKLAQDLIPELDGKNELPFELTIFKVSIMDDLHISDDLSSVKEIWYDYQPNSLAWPLMSERMKDVIDNNCSDMENIDWLEATINAGSEKRKYYIIRFNKQLDVLNEQKTMYVEGTDHIIKPVFAHEKVKRFAIFTKPMPHGLWKITSTLYVNESVKKAIANQKLTGIDFERVSVD